MLRSSALTSVQPLGRFVCLSCLSKRINPNGLQLRHARRNTTVASSASSKDPNGSPSGQKLDDTAIASLTSPSGDKQVYQKKKQKAKDERKSTDCNNASNPEDRPPSFQTVPVRGKEAATPTAASESVAPKHQKILRSKRRPVGIVRKVRTDGKVVHAEVGELARRKKGPSSEFLQAHAPQSIRDAMLSAKDKGFQRRGAIHHKIDVVRARDLEMKPVELTKQPPTPTLSYGLDRVLFNPGVYSLQDPRSKVFNFDPYLQKIMPVADFDFNALREYITSSRDESLKTITQSLGKKYMGSSSSMTAVLAHFHFLLSQWRPVNTNMLSQGFEERLTSFTKIQRHPSAIILHWQDGSYAIDADKMYDDPNILSMLGRSMEKLLTLPTRDFERYRKPSSQVSDEERNGREAFHYCSMGDFLMRSQLDAHDPRLPGTGMFDLKTRAVVSIRMDVKGYEQGMDYEIMRQHGTFESYEREYYDMIRAAFLKYSLQVRMGRMDGIFVAFHNTKRIFGFQYISLNDMDAAIHGASNTRIGDQEFKLSLELLNKTLDRATKEFPKQSLRIHFETRESGTPFMYLFAEPVSDEEIRRIQSTNKEKFEEFEREVLGIERDETPEQPKEASDHAEEAWEELHTKVEEEMDEDELFPERSATGSSAGDEGDSDRRYRANRSDTAGSATSETQDSVEEDNSDKQHQPAGAFSAEDETAVASDNSHEIEMTAAQEALSMDAGIAEEEGKEEDDGDKEDPLQSDEVDEENVVTDSTQDIDLQIKGNEVGEDREADYRSAELDEQADLVVEDTEDHGDSNWLSQVDKERQQRVAQSEERPLLAMTLTIRNKVNGEYVTRPDTLKERDDWSVEYSIGEVSSPSRSVGLYEACQTRREKGLKGTQGDVESPTYHVLMLRELSKKGRQWRKEQDSIEAKSGRVVFSEGKVGETKDGTQ
ncbi:MAG: hypothetical protein M1825_003848 [Sarcosagium campestre]|nr:MAG: hypothetical protein M1825_003848 [Sarcosagium campestre]